jgi:hypothetical protein
VQLQVDSYACTDRLIYVNHTPTIYIQTDFNRTGCLEEQYHSRIQASQNSTVHAMRPRYFAQ